MTLEKEQPIQNIYTFLGVTNPRTKRSNKVAITIPKHVRSKLKKYREESNAMSWAHCFMMMKAEIELNRQMLRKLDIAIRRAIEENNVNYFIKEFLEHATEQEKSYYEALVNGALNDGNTEES